MDLLKAEIEAKRKELEKLATGKTDGKRFAIRRADLERQREEQYLEEERNREEERQVTINSRSFLKCCRRGCKRSCLPRKFLKRLIKKMNKSVMK